jgi:hypothetical protein
MGRGPLYAQDFRPQFTGHETFPLRFGWLKKVFDAIRATEDLEENNKAVFLADDAIANFGVGKNMVGAMRYWALAAGIIVDETRSFKGPFKTTVVGRKLLGDHGWDPYLESQASLWFLHWQFAGDPKYTTTWFYALNYFGAVLFTREQLTEAIRHYCAERFPGEFATYTLRRDVDCFLRSYVARNGTVDEESIEAVLTELGLITSIGKGGAFVMRRGPKPTLPDAVFWYGLLSYARATARGRSLAVETLTHDPGSPGRVFLLDEESLVERLSRAEEETGGAVEWSETAGLRQIFFRNPPTETEPLELLAKAYRAARARRAA